MAVIEWNSSAATPPETFHNGDLYSVAETVGDWPEPNDVVISIAARNGLSSTVEHRFHPKLY